MAPRSRALFDRFPALAALAPLDLCTLPTPVESLPALAANAWVKRDDQTHPEYGGNKLRKLEYVGAEMQRRHARRAILFGATGTNAGVAAAMVCRQLGIALDILTFDQPPSSTVQKNQALLAHYGARTRHIGPLFATALAWHLHPRRLDPRTYFLFAGCSNPIATFAFVEAAFELKAQIDAGLCPAPERIVLAAGSCATVAGLTLGCALAGLPTQVIGVRVSPATVVGVDACTAPLVTRMMAACHAEVARRSGETLPPLPAATVDDTWYGDGYGAASAPGAAAASAFARVGLTLEQTYTAKAAAAFLHQLSRTRGPVLFWSTFAGSAPAVG